MQSKTNLITAFIFVISLSFFIVFLIGSNFVFASFGGDLAQGLPGGGSGSGSTGGGLVPCTNNCNFGSLITLVQNITEFLLLIAAPVATLLFAWAGFQYITAAGDTGKIKKAHQIFWTVFWGIVFMASAWLFVKIMVDTLGAGSEAPAGGEFLDDIKNP